jgi:hypothetical protein
MALGHAEWTKLITGSVDRLADRNYQERAWFGKSNEISSPDEMFSELFDDLDFEDYLRSEEIRLTERQRELGRVLEARMNQYANRTPPILDPHKVIDDPEWDEIRRAAQKFGNLLKQGRMNADGE